MSVDLGSTQSSSGDVTATSYGYAENVTYGQSATTAAVGNQLTAYTSGANLRGSIDQTVDQGVSISADGHLDMPGTANQVAMSTTAQGNSAFVGATGGWQETTTTQSSGATIYAQSGADLDLVNDTAAIATVAAGNNFTSAVDMGSGSTVLNQSQTGDSVYAGSFVAAAQAQTLASTAAASGNTAIMSSAYGPMDVQVSQDNSSYVRAQDEVGVYAYGAATSTASGVGNALMVSNLGAETTIDVNQTTTGGVDVSAGFVGGPGYDSTVQSTAIGNSIMATACSTCTATYSASSNQVNNDGVSSVATSNLTGVARGAVVSANAVGNSASYYISRPSGG